MEFYNTLWLVAFGGVLVLSALTVLVARDSAPVGGRVRGAGADQGDGLRPETAIVAGGEAAGGGESGQGSGAEGGVNAPGAEGGAAGGGDAGGAGSGGQAGN